MQKITLDTVTPEVLRNMLEAKLAKSMGFKNKKEANKNGYNTKRVSCSLTEIREILKVSTADVNILVNDWQLNNLADHVDHGGLNCIYFKETYQFQLNQKK